MQEIAISKFKATCLAVLERVRRTRQPVRVTRFGDPVAEVVPSSANPKKKRWLGSMSGKGRIVGDIVSPSAYPGAKVRPSLSSRSCTWADHATECWLISKGPRSPMARK